MKKKVVMVARCDNPYPKSYFQPRVQGFMGKCKWAYNISFTDGTGGLLFANKPLEVNQVAVVRLVGKSNSTFLAIRNDFYKVVKERV